jgi:hypothetical protein
MQVNTVQKPLLGDDLFNAVRTACDAAASVRLGSDDHLTRACGD